MNVSPDAAAPDLAQTRFILPQDAKVLPVAELSARVRARIGAQGDGQAVVARQGFRVTTRLVPRPLAELLGEFRTPTRLTDGVLRFARAQGQDPQAVLEAAFDALATLVEAQLLLPEGAPEAAAPGPSLVAGQNVAGYEIEAPVRSLDDSEVFRARGDDGHTVALKIARDARPGIAATLAHEALMLRRLDSRDVPRLLAQGEHDGRPFLALEWCSGVSVGAAAQALRAARDRPRLHALVARLLQAYGRLHRQGVLHGDVHPGNCLVDEQGRVVILDFGHARPVGDAAAIDIARAGIPQFHDPQMAAALVAGRPAPAASPASEQYAVAVLAYLLLSGLHPVEAPAVQDELLRRIATRAPLPFAARGAPSWPAVEAVLRRALAHEPGDRFTDLAAMAEAFESAGHDDGAAAGPRHPRRGVERALSTTAAAVRALRDGPGSCRDRAWFALRAAQALDDAELLAAADLLAAQAGGDALCCLLRARLAQARSDLRAEGRAFTRFLQAAGSQELPADRVLLAAARMLESSSPRCGEAGALAAWAAAAVRRRWRAAGTGPAATDLRACEAALALARSGRVAADRGLERRLEAMRGSRGGSVWLWSLAHEVFGDGRFLPLAMAARLPAAPMSRCFALLRRHQLTGDTDWLAQAHRTAASAAGLPQAAVALLAAELRSPESAVMPPFASVFGVPLR